MITKEQIKELKEKAGVNKFNDQSVDKLYELFGQNKSKMTNEENNLFNLIITIVESNKTLNVDKIYQEVNGQEVKFKKIAKEFVTKKQSDGLTKFEYEVIVVNLIYEQEDLDTDEEDITTDYVDTIYDGDWSKYTDEKNAIELAKDVIRYMKTVQKYSPNEQELINEVYQLKKDDISSYLNLQDITFDISDLIDVNDNNQELCNYYEHASDALDSVENESL